MLDVNQIMLELKEMRIATGKSQANFSVESGVSLWSVKAVEGGHGPLHVDDMEKWLIACKSSTVEFITRQAALQGLEKQLARSAETAETMRRFGLAMKDRRRRREISQYLAGMFEDESGD